MDDYKDGEILVNPQTGERIQLVRGEWKPVLSDLKDRATAAIAATPKSESPIASGVMRGMALGARDLMTGAMGLPAMAADVATAPFTAARNAAVTGYNKLTDSNVPTQPVIGGTGQAFQSVLDAAGFPKPQDDTERMLSAVTQGVGGVGTGFGVAPSLARSASPVAQRLASVLTTAPRTQLAVGAASPAAGEATRQAGGGPIAQTAAQLATAGALSIPSAIARVPQTAATDQLRAASNAAYKAAENAGAVFKPNAYDNFVSSLVTKIENSGYLPKLQPKIAAVLEELDAQKGTAKSLEKLELLRRVNKNAMGSKEADEQRLAGIVQDELDDFVSKAGPADILAGNAPLALSELKNARKLWSQASKSDAIETLIDRANISAPNFSASGIENALRTEFRALAKNPKKMRLFAPDEQEAIRKVAMGDLPVNALRELGRFGSPGVVGTTLSSGLGMLFGGPVGAVALPLAGRAARAGSAVLQQRNADMAAALMRGGKLSKTTGINRDQLAAALAAMGAANAGQQ